MLQRILSGLHNQWDVQSVLAIMQKKKKSSGVIKKNLMHGVFSTVEQQPIFFFVSEIQLPN